MYDAQSQAMGGTGTAFLTTPAAAIHNPANLDMAPDTQLQLSLSSMAVQMQASFAGEGNEQSSGWILVPLAFLGGSARVADRFTLGGAVYIPMGFGGSFDGVEQYGTGTPCLDGFGDILLNLGDADAQNADYCPSEPRDESVTMVVIEAAVPMSVRVLDNLRLGLALRFPYGVMIQNTSQDIFGALSSEPAGNYGLGYAQVSSNMKGFGTPGILFGATYDPIDWLTLAVSYRSKVRVHMEGTTDMNLRSNELIGGLLDTAGGLPIDWASGLLPDLGIQPGDTVNSYVDRLTTNIPSSTDWYVAHALELATALHLLDHRLLIATELRMQFSKEANQGLTVQLDDPTLASMGFESFTQRFDWRNFYGLNFGTQLMATENLALRLGFNCGNSIIPPHTAGQFAPPPGFAYSVTAGAGVTAKSIQIDVSVAYGAGGPFRIHQQYDANGDMVYEPTCRPGMTIKSGCPGRYEVDTFFLGIGLTYRPSSDEPERAPDEPGATPPEEPAEPEEGLPPAPA